MILYCAVQRRYDTVTLHQPHSSPPIPRQSLSTPSHQASHFAPNLQNPCTTPLLYLPCHLTNGIKEWRTCQTSPSPTMTNPPPPLSPPARQNCTKPNLHSRNKRAPGSPFARLNKYSPLSLSLQMATGRWAGGGLTRGGSRQLGD